MGEMPGLRVVEICAGAGGQSLGLHLAGFEHDLAVELDVTAAATLARNLARLATRDGSAPPRVVVGDVADPDVWAPSDYAGVDLLAGGVPCPPFSDAGLQRGALDERDLFAWAVEQVGVIRPRAVLLENVRGLSRPRFGAYRQAVADRLADLGYWSEWRLLHSSDYGVPQLRPRFVLVAMSFDDAPYFHWPERVPCKATVGSTLRSAMASNGWLGAAAWAKQADDIAPTIVGGSKKHGGADLGPTRAKQAWARLGVNAKGVADEAPGPGFSDVRGPMLTTSMVAMLQGWKGQEYRWDFEGRKTSRYRQIGNAFPPPVARAIGSAIASALHRAVAPRELPDQTILHDSLYRALRSSNAFVGTADLVAAMHEGMISEQSLKERLLLIGKDFVLDTRVSGGETLYRLGDFKAFRGQEEHLRHAAFVARSARSKIS